MNGFRCRRAVCGAAGLGALWISGCATYRPLALPAAPDLTAAPAVTVAASRLDLPGLEAHPIDPSGPWDETAVVTLAILNNPDLKAARLLAGVADAQVVEAGLLPDPVLSAGWTRSVARRGYSLGLSQEVADLITSSPKRQAAVARAREVNLEILWQEWQVAARVRDLFLQARANRRLRTVLGRDEELAAQRYRAETDAMHRGDATTEAVARDLEALNAAADAVRALELDCNQTDHDLAALLGLEPGTALPLGDVASESAISPEAFRAAVAALPHRRADLLALRAAYESQEQRLRAAVLAQFPALSVGVEQGRSAEEGVHTTGFSVSLTLPLFNRNRGRIAIERTTRAALRQAYQARLDQAVSEADRVWQATQIMKRQLEALDARLRGMHATAVAAETAYRAGTLTVGAYATINSTDAAAQADQIRLRTTLARAEAALAAVLGSPDGG